MSEVYHWGILGMKWGHRKARDVVGGSGGSSGKTEPTHSEDHKKVTELRKKKASELSNAEIQAVLNRANLEKQFAELNKKQVSAGEKVVKELLLNAAKKSAASFLDENAAKIPGMLTKALSSK